MLFRSLAAHDNALVDRYDDANLEADELAALQQLHDAIVNDPVYAAAIAVRAAKVNRYDSFYAAQGAAARVGRTFNNPSPPSPWWTMADHIHAIVETEAGRIAAERRAETDQARINAGDGL